MIEEYSDSSSIKKNSPLGLCEIIDIHVRTSTIQVQSKKLNFTLIAEINLFWQGDRDSDGDKLTRSQRQS